MPRPFTGALTLTLVLSVSGVRAQAPGAEPLPAPRPAPGPVVVVPPAYAPPPPVYYRRSAYEVWQYYGVDQRGRFRPRVVLDPGHDPYYLATGRPYPWLSTNARFVQPFVEGVPYRNFMPYARD